MKVAIIGSTSFLAKYIIRELLFCNINPSLYGMSSSLEFPDLDFTVFKFPEHPINYSDLLVFDVVIYTAGAGIQVNKNETPETIYELNSFIPIRMLISLAINNYTGKVLTFGSYFEIGNENTKRYYSENEIISSINKVPNHYSVSKRILSRYLSSSLHNLQYYHLILPNIYGIGENEQRLIPYLIAVLRNDEDIKLTSGEQVRQYIHAADIAKTVFDITTSDYTEGFYNLCRSEAIQIKELVKKIFILQGKEDKINDFNFFGSKERSDTSMQYLLLNNSKAANTFRYQPHISIEEGIKTYL